MAFKILLDLNLTYSNVFSQYTTLALSSGYTGLLY